MKKNFTKTLLLGLLAMMGTVQMQALESYDFQELCMKLGKGGPWAVNDGGDAGFTIGEAQMHYLGDYTDQGFAWNQRFAYEYVEGRDKFTMRNKNNNKDSNCGMFSWDYAHYFSILGLKKDDKVTITVGTGTVTFVSENVEGVSAGDNVDKSVTYVFTEDEGRLDIQMAKASLIAKIVIEPAGVETVPVITLSAESVKLIPGATYQLKATIDPPSMSGQWKSSDDAVVTVSDAGLVTAVGAGTATVSCYWESEVSDATAEATCEFTIADVDLSALTVVKDYDFASMGDIALEIESEACAQIFNYANAKNNGVFFCTNEGLEAIAVQAVAATNGKGWSIADGKGLFLGTGAGRCAAVSGIVAGQVVEFLYSAGGFYTSDSDDGIAKTALSEGAGRVIYQADADGMIGFELDKGQYVSRITIYGDDTVEAISTVETRTAQSGIVYNLAGQRVAQPRKGLYVKGGKLIIEN